MKLGGCSIIALALSFILGPASALAHSAPPSTYTRCKGWVGGGDNVFTGTIHAVPKNSVQQFYVRIVASYSAGWSGVWSINNSPDHDRTNIPAGTGHWSPSPAILISGASYLDDVNPLARKIHGFVNCGGGTGCDGGGGYPITNYGYKVDVDADISSDTLYGVDIYTTGYWCD